jgi:LmbE family N-acetylglucosaminyl deacetylase
VSGPQFFSISLAFIAILKFLKWSFWCGLDTAERMEMNRREMLVGTSRVVPGLVAGSSALAPAAEPKELRKLKIIVVGGHPGDPEYGCGGTVVRLTSLGHEVVMLYLNNGAWPPTPASVRIEEARSACAILKARPVYAGQNNGHAVVDDTHYDAFQKLIESEKPDAVFNQWPLDNHADHRAISMLTYGAWTKLQKKFALYYYEVSDGEDTMQFAPGIYVDITEVEALKRQACYAHASQSPDRYYEVQDAVAHFRGLQSGFKRAEGYIRQIANPYDIFALAGLATR